MFYKKSKSKELDFELYKNPTKEYRAAPFWAWNTKLEKDVLLEQIEALKQMGFGGFFMHSRSGLNTEYLGEEFMQMVKDCRDKAEKEDMLAYLYDEDKWPSGYGGGYVSKTPKYRQKHLTFSVSPKDFYDKQYAIENAVPYLLGVYDVVLDEKGFIKSYAKIGENDTAKGVKRYAYVCPVACEPWHNGFTPEDAMLGEAVKKFIDVTYEKYKDSVGESFGKSVPAIFTDEPQMGFKRVMAYSTSNENASVPWTDALCEEYFKAYGDDVTDFLPELFLDLPNDEVSVARYRYHQLSTHLFTETYSKQIGKWCKDNGILFTGHMLWEHTLESQTNTVGDAMRAYEWYDIPGIDLLCDAVELVTAKQTQSVVRQLNKDGMLTELYGVTNWDFDFRGHKFQGDWQAALGATLRVPHLAWVSMKGSAKRDYPASINYQVPWYKEYGYVEDHFARLNTVLTRGTPIVKVGVIHPIESFWLEYGPQNTSSNKKKALDVNFENLCSWLYQGSIDYDLLCEDMLPNHASVKSAKFNVGVASYQTIIVPPVKTLRTTTFNLLKQFSDNGGKLIFLGDCPTHLDAIKSSKIKSLYDSSINAKFDKLTLFDLLTSERTMEVYNGDGSTAENFFHQIRQDGEDKWLFIAHSSKPTKMPKIDVANSQSLTIVLDGEYTPTLYDTISGEIKQIDFKTENGKTYIYKTIYDFDSLLIKLEKGAGSYLSPKLSVDTIKVIDFKKTVEYSRSEDNVLLVDICKYALNDGEFFDDEEILKIDEKVRKILKYPKADGMGVQPWALPDNKPENYVTLKYSFESKTNVDNVFIAGEEAEKIVFNDKQIDLTQVGYYVDKQIKKYRLGSIVKGENTILITAPITHRISVENYYILGDFDVVVKGVEKIVVEKCDKIGFSDITSQGMPFYGGNVTYKMQVEVPNCDLKIRANRYRNALLKVKVDGAIKGVIAYPPYTLKVDDVESGNHLIEITAYGNRVNTFGPIHDAGHRTYVSPTAWYTTGYKYSYDYEPKATGLLSSPVIEVLKR